MSTRKIGYARTSTAEQRLGIEAQRDALTRLGVAPEDIYTDQLSGTTRERPGLAQALAAVRAGDALVVAKLDRLARSISDARAIADELEAKGVALSIGGSIHDPRDPVGRLLFNVLAMIGEFEADLISERTKAGLTIAKQRGRLRGKQPKLSAVQRKQLLRLVDEGEMTQAEVGEIFGVSRTTVQREIARRGLS